MQGFKTHDFAGGNCLPCWPRSPLTKICWTLPSFDSPAADGSGDRAMAGAKDGRGASRIASRPSRHARALGRNHDLRLRQLATLRDAFTDLGDDEKAAAAQKELLECHAELFGDEHDATFAARATLAQNPAAGALPAPVPGDNLVAQAFRPARASARRLESLHSFKRQQRNCPV